MAILNGRSNTSGNAPSTLLDGQININQADGILFSRNPDGSIRRTLFPKRISISDANFQIRIFDTYVGIKTLTASRTVSLPLAALYPAGTQLKIADESGAVTASITVNLAVSTGSQDSVNGATNLMFTTPYFGATLVSDGTSKWTATGLASGGAGASLLYTPQTLTAAQMRQALANLALSAANLRMTEIQAATNKGSYFGLVDGLADGFADSSGIDTANAVNANVQGGAVLNQANDPNTLSLNHYDGANGATSSADVVTGDTVSFNGSASISTAQSVFGGASLRLAALGSYTSTTYASGAVIGTGDFTVEGRVRFDGVGSAQVFYSTTSSGNAAGFYLFLRGSDGKLALQDYASGTAYGASATAPAANTWYAFAFVRTGGVLKTYINGTQESSVAYTANLGTLTGHRVGVDQNAGNGTVGYVDEVRASNIARYTGSTYPVAAAAFTYGSSGVLTLPSINYGLTNGTPTKGSIFIRARATAGAIAPNTNFLASLSINGTLSGNTGSLPNTVQVPLAATAVLPDGYTHYEANEVDLTGLAPGSTLKSIISTVGTTLGVAIDGVRILAH